MGVVAQTASITEVRNDTVLDFETEEQVEVPEWMSDEEAVAAAEAVMQRKAWEAELEALEASFASTSAAYDAAEAAYVEQKMQLEKDLNVY
jgi:hypothetical protein